jgi:hypothetical protein
LWSYALHTAVTFLCEESYQRHTKNLLVFGFPAEGGVPPSIPSVKHKTFVMDEGERHGVTVGETSPLRRYQRGHFLFDTLLDTFLVKEKYPQEWAAQAHITN